MLIQTLLLQECLYKAKKERVQSMKNVGSQGWVQVQASDLNSKSKYLDIFQVQEQI